MKKGRAENIDSPFDAADSVRAGHGVCCATGGMCTGGLMVVLCVSVCEKIDGLWMYICREGHFLVCVTIGACICLHTHFVTLCVGVFRGVLIFFLCSVCFLDCLKVMI